MTKLAGQNANGGRRREVRDAALTLFAANGYSGTSMADIARALERGAPSLYNHIASKSALLHDVCVETLNEILKLQQDAMSTSDFGLQLRMMTETLVRFSATHRREVAMVAREFIHLDGDARQEVLDLRHQFERRFRDFIERGRESGDFATPRPQLASYAIIEMSLAVAQWYRDEGPMSVETVAEDYGTFALRLAGCCSNESK